MLTYVDEIESDLSVFHGLDFWTTSVAVALRFARLLPAYEGALRRAMEYDADQTPPAAELPTAHPQAVEQPAPAEGDTPPEVVARLQQQAMIKTMQSMGVEVTEIRHITDTEMDRLVRSG